MPRGVIVLLAIAALVVTVAGIKSFSGVVGPTFLALMLTVAVHPLPGWLRRKGFPGWLALLTTLLAVWGILVALVVSLVYSVARLSTILPQYSDKFDDIVNDLQATLKDHGIGSDQIHKLLSNVDSSKVISIVSDIVGSALGVFSNLVFVLVLLLFMTVDAITYDKRMTILGNVRPDVVTAFQGFASGTRTYLIVSTIFGLIVAVLDVGVLWAMGIPLPFLWGLLAFITNYIPNIGFVIGLVPPALLALLDGGWALMLWVIIIYSAINVIIQSIIQPKFVGDAVGLSVTLTFLSLVFWAWVLGPLGAILAIPLTLMCKALLIDMDPATRWADVLLSDAPPKDDPSPPDNSADKADGEAPPGDALAKPV
ncbi:AI-2E family transporter [Gordonia rubripertincta]|uniref:AI-2E family transporter n=2 Tax=Gordonia rubripertincta TaxID=36822 RepID=A0ABT4MPM4_GORRU|nr:AI-2E family transporter [Gordonia rubripertincta]MCZ4548961.1 AI-2E family transporter [Gordonia rubripertincta]